MAPAYIADFVRTPESQTYAVWGDYIYARLEAGDWDETDIEWLNRQCALTLLDSQTTSLGEWMERREAGR